MYQISQLCQGQCFMNIHQFRKHDTLSCKIVLLRISALRELPVFQLTVNCDGLVVGYIDGKHFKRLLVHRRKGVQNEFFNDCNLLKNKNNRWIRSSLIQESIIQTVIPLKNINHLWHWHLNATMTCSSTGHSLSISIGPLNQRQRLTESKAISLMSSSSGSGKA